MTDIFKEIDRQGASLDSHVDELHQVILAAQRFVRAYDRAASEVIKQLDREDFKLLDLIEAIQELRRVYERRQV